MKFEYSANHNTKPYRCNIRRGSANKIGATIGTTTTAISIKSRKKPKRNITSITTMNCDQNPPVNLTGSV